MLYDLVVIGGGINGCGCAADAAMRGLSVLLCEKDDIASKTSSSSSQLIHGGLRYLEHYDISMVKKALDEQQILMDRASYLVRSLPLILPHDAHTRPLWLIQTGLFLYDHLSHSNTLPNSKRIDRVLNPQYFSHLKQNLTDGFIFYDCTADDARLTIVNALQAQKHGAKILAQTSLIHAENKYNNWQLTLQPKYGATFQIQARAVINATGPWVESVSKILKIPLEYNMSLVKGSHMVVHKLYEGEHAYLLQNEDKRVVFVIPYHGHTLIGTTDVAYKENLDAVSITPDEVDYLCQLIKRYFNKPLNKADIIMTWSGVRPLLSTIDKNASELSRDYAFHYSATPAPALTVYGGKITTYRRLALEAINQLKSVFPDITGSKSGSMPLPGSSDIKAYEIYAREKYHWLHQEILDHYLTTYGSLTDRILANCNNTLDLGISFTNLLYQVEVDYLINEEWVFHADDILWRRTKLGLSTDNEQYQTLVKYLASFTQKTQTTL